MNNMDNIDNMERPELNEDFFVSDSQEDEVEFCDPEEIDEDYAGTNKENVQIVVIAKQPNTKPKQMQTIHESVQDIAGKDLSKAALLSFWDKLTDKLNAMGPPIRSRPEWRRIWSTFKSNKKRKLSTDSMNQLPDIGSDDKKSSQAEVLESCDAKSSLSKGIPSAMKNSLQGQNTQSSVHSSHLSYDIKLGAEHSETAVDKVLQKFDLLLQKQDEMIGLMTTMCTLLTVERK